MANISLTSAACGDFTVGGYDGTTTITTTTSTSGCILDSSSLIGTSGDFTFTGGGSGIVSSNYSYGFDKSMISGKEGEILMDLKNMKFKVYSDEKGWVEYDMEDFSTKNKKVELNGSRDISVQDILIERNKRTVLIEKMPKKKEVPIGNGIWIDVTAGTNNLYIGNPITINATPAYYNYRNPQFINTVNLIGNTGINNVAVGYTTLADGQGTLCGGTGAITNGTAYASGLCTNGSHTTANYSQALTTTA